MSHAAAASADRPAPPVTSIAKCSQCHCTLSDGKKSIEIVNGTLWCDACAAKYKNCPKTSCGGRKTFAVHVGVCAKCMFAAQSLDCTSCGAKANTGVLTDGIFVCYQCGPMPKVPLRNYKKHPFADAASSSSSGTSSAAASTEAWGHIVPKRKRGEDDDQPEGRPYKRPVKQ